MLRRRPATEQIPLAGRTRRFSFLEEPLGGGSIGHIEQIVCLSHAPRRLYEKVLDNYRT